MHFNPPKQVSSLFSTGKIIVERGDERIDGRLDNIFVDARTPIGFAALFHTDEGERLRIGLFAERALFVGGQFKFDAEVRFERLGNGVGGVVPCLYDGVGAGGEDVPIKGCDSC